MKCNTSESQTEQLEHIKNLIDSSTELFTQYEPVYKNIDSTFVKDPTNKYLLFFRNVASYSRRDPVRRGRKGERKKKKCKTQNKQLCVEQY